MLLCLVAFCFIIPRNNCCLLFRSRKSQTLYTSTHLILGGQTDKATSQSFWSLHFCFSFSRKMAVFGARSKCVWSLKSPCNAWMKALPSVKGNFIKAPDSLWEAKSILGTTCEWERRGNEFSWVPLLLTTLLLTFLSEKRKVPICFSLKYIEMIARVNYPSNKI